MTKEKNTAFEPFNLPIYFGNFTKRKPKKYLFSHYGWNKLFE